jgi:hypothetical protein
MFQEQQYVYTAQISNLPFGSQIHQICTLCATKIKHLKSVKSETESDVSVQLVSSFQSFVISLYLSVCGFSLPSTNYNYLCQMPVKQRHQYVCLI